MYTHHLIHTDLVFREVKCTACNEIIAKDVTNCLGCLKQFQQISKNPYMKCLDLGWELPIVS